MADPQIKTQPHTSLHIVIAQREVLTAEEIVAHLRKHLKREAQFSLVHHFAELGPLLQSNTPDLLLLDAHLTQAPSDKILKAIAHLDDALPILVTSRRSSVAEAVAVMREGARGYFDLTETAQMVTLVKQELKAGREIPPATTRSSRNDPFFSHILDLQDDYICRYDPEYRLTYVNRAYCEWQEKTASELLGESILPKIIDEDRGIAIEKVQTLTPEAPFRSSVHRSLSEDGKIEWVEWRDWALFDEAGEVIEYQGIGRDVTEQRRTQHELLFHSQILQTMDEGVLITSVETVEIVYANPTFEKMFGYESGELIGHSPSILNAPDAAAPILEMNETLTRTGKLETEFKNIRKDGTLFWSRANVVEFEHDVYGTIWLAVQKDITEEKKAKQALEQANATLERRVEERTRELVERDSLLLEMANNFPNAYVVIVESDYTIGYASGREFLDQALDPESYIGRRVEGLFPEQEERLLYHLGRCFEGEEQLLELVDDVRVLEVRAVPIVSPSGKIERILAVSVNVTERKLAEEKMVALSNRIQLATEVGNIGIWEWDVQQDTMSYDQRLVEMYGFTEGDELSDPETWSRAIHVDHSARLIERMQEALRGEAALHIEVPITLKDGSERYLKIDGIVQYDEQGVPTRVIGCTRDISDLKRAELTLRSNLRQEKQLGELKSRFISMASHEFRTPLTTILGSADLLLMYRSRFDEDQIEEKLVRIRNQVKYMEEIIEELLDFAKIQETEPVYNPVPGYLSLFCEDIMVDMESQAQNRGRIQFSDRSSQTRIPFDRKLMRQVITNITSNALKYSKGAVEVEIWDSENCFCLEIRDHGIGIPQKDIKYLFSPFNRASNVGEIKGTGLGLYITKRAIDAHQGDIYVESEAGEGATFRISLPKQNGHPS